MAKYFKIVEIDEETFAKNTGAELDCAQVVVSVGNSVFVAVDDDEEYEIAVPIDAFEKGGESDA